MEPEAHQGVNDILKGVVAFVEVRSSNDNRSAAIGQELAQLGARVEPAFSDAVTHVVYKEGLKRTWNRASKRGVPVVSVSWLDSCKQHMKRMPESEFPAILPEEMSSPLIGINQTSRWKKMRSMQPCDFDEEIARSAERGEKRRKRIQMANRFKLAEEATPTSSPVPILAMETQPRALMFGTMSQTSSPVPDTPPSMKERLERMKQMHVLLDKSATKTPKVQSERPLQKRLFEKLADDFASVGTSSDEERENTSAMVNGLIHRLNSDDEKGDSSCSRSNSVVYAVEDFSFKPLSPKDPAKSKERKCTPSAMQNRRRSSRLAPNSLHPLCGTKPISGTELKTERSDFEPQNLSGKEKEAAKSPERLSLALSPKDTNIYIPEVKAFQADFPPNSILSENVFDSEGKSQSSRNSENCADKGKQRRRSCRISSINNDNSLKSPFRGLSLNDQPGVSSNKTSKSNLTNLDSINPKPSKKKRNLFTEPVLDSSLIKPSAKNLSSNQTADLSVPTNIIFGMTDKTRPESTCKGVGKRSKNSSVSMSKTKFDKLAGQKASCEKSVNEMTSNDTIDSSMSVMYANDTLPGEIRDCNNRRSIDEFHLSKKLVQRTKSGKALKRANSGERRESSKEVKSHQAPVEKPETVKRQNAKRSRASSSSGDNTETVSAKKQKFKYSSSDSDEKMSSPSQLDRVQPRLRHALSLVLEPPQSPAVHRVQYSLVVTSLHRQEQELVYSVLKKLGVFHLTNSVEACSTHVVCGEPRRTLNLLKAIARGCFVLAKEWVFKSLEAGSWLREEDFELDKDLPVIKKSRLARQQAGDNYRVDLFSSAGPIFVASNCKPPRKEIVHLIQLCSGIVTGAQTKACVCIGEFSEPDKRIVKPTWVLDSIMRLECLPLENYILSAPKPVFSQRESSPEF